MIDRVPAAKRIRLSDGATLHFIERGEGYPTILLHGGMDDMRSWSSQIDAFSCRYRTISYSRRHSEPNENPFTVPSDPAAANANDLAELMQALDIDSAHLIGTSYGALIALTFALRWPSRVTSLTLSEPPMHGWLEKLPDGTAVHDRFMREVWGRAAAEFKDGKSRQAMEILGEAFDTRAGMAECAANGLPLRNARAMMALALSEEPFPRLDRTAVARLATPTLVVRGEASDLIHTIGATELTRLLKRVCTAVIPGAGHRVPTENPEAFNQVVLEFLRTVAKSSSARS
jgi:non-heme chloroperoxidase